MKGRRLIPNIPWTSTKGSKLEAKGHLDAAANWALKHKYYEDAGRCAFSNLKNIQKSKLYKKQLKGIKRLLENPTLRIPLGVGILRVIDQDKKSLLGYPPSQDLDEIYSILVSYEKFVDIIPLLPDVPDPANVIQMSLSWIPYKALEVCAENFSLDSKKRSYLRSEKALDILNKSIRTITAVTENTEILDMWEDLDQFVINCFRIIFQSFDTDKAEVLLDKIIEIENRMQEYDEDFCKKRPELWDSIYIPKEEIDKNRALKLVEYCLKIHEAGIRPRPDGPFYWWSKAMAMAAEYELPDKMLEIAKEFTCPIDVAETVIHMADLDIVKEEYFKEALEILESIGEEAFLIPFYNNFDFDTYNISDGPRYRPPEPKIAIKKGGSSQWQSPILPWEKVKIPFKDHNDAPEEFWQKLRKRAYHERVDYLKRQLGIDIKKKDKKVPPKADEKKIDVEKQLQRLKERFEYGEISEKEYKKRKKELTSEKKADKKEPVGKKTAAKEKQTTFSQEDTTYKLICPSCEKEVQEDWKLCPYCGAEFEA